MRVVVTIIARPCTRICLAACVCACAFVEGCSRPCIAVHVHVHVHVHGQVDPLYLRVADLSPTLGSGQQDSLLVRVETNVKGVVGWGECDSSPLVGIAAYVHVHVLAGHVDTMGPSCLHN